MVDRAPLDTFDSGPAIRFARQAQFQPLKYLIGLAQAVERLGGKIYTGTHVTIVQGGEDAFVATDRGPRGLAGAIVVVTNPPINDLVVIHTKQAAYATYCVALPIPRDAVPPGLYWDTLDAYHYIRVQLREGPSDLLIVGGEDHKLGQEPNPQHRFQRLEAWAGSRFRILGPAEYRWSGIVMETTDGLAFIGRNPGDKDNVYIATGDSGMGLTHGTIAGMLLSDLILGREHPWSKIYDPSRIPVWGMAWKEYLKENANIAWQYAKDWLGDGDVSDVQEIQPGSGAILRRGARKVAVYRDDHDELQEMSAVCPHLQCIVHWNKAERCWDCPCHGSRYGALGEVLNGPANTPLEPLPLHARADDA